MTKPHQVPSKLPAAVANQIRHRHENGESATALAKEFGIGRTSIYDVIAARKFTFRVSVRLSPEHAARLDRRCGRLRGDGRQKLVDAVFSIGLEALDAEDDESSAAGSRSTEGSNGFLAPSLAS